jgi:hypothetical protein
MTDDERILIYTGLNDQVIQLTGLVDQTGTAITGATITATLSRAGAVLPNGTVTFTDVPSQAGNYSGTLTGFNGATGPAVLQVTGVHGGVHFGFQANVQVDPRFV